MMDGISAAKPRDKHIDAMLFWGVIFVVMGHSYQIPYFFFPAYTFHMAFFFFISGYVFRVYHTAGEKAAFIWKKVRVQLIPYFVLNLAFGILTMFLAKSGIRQGQALSWRSLFVEPFLSGHQFYLNLCSWFLLSLFLINVIAQILTFRNSRRFRIALFCVILPVALFAVSQGLNHYKDFRLPLVRTAYGLLFFYIGILFQEYKDKILKVVLRPEVLLGAWSLVAVLNNIYGRINYSIAWGSVENPYFVVPLVTTFLIILISYAVCYYISRLLHDGAFFLKIGQHSFYIMILHLFIFFLVNMFLYAGGWVEFSALSKKYYYVHEPKKLFLFYVLPGIVIPVWIGMFSVWAARQFSAGSGRKSIFPKRFGNNDAKASA